MADETVKQEKTFTQEDVDRIVTERLSRDRKNYADYDELKEKAARLDEIEEANKTELQKATDRANALQKELDGLRQAETIRSMRDRVAQETGVPANLLTGDSEESCMAQAQAIRDYARPGAYPAVRDGGEANAPRAKKSTRDQFKEAFNSLM